jgi:hypothetical protein
MKGVIVNRKLARFTKPYTNRPMAIDRVSDPITRKGLPDYAAIYPQGG